MITRETILDIINQGKDPSISIYLPTHEKGEQVQQDPIRLKNLLKQAEKELSEREMKQNEIDQLLEEPRKLLEQGLFWQHSERGLALFINPDYFEYFRVPLEFKERVMVDDHFLITPLLPMISLEGTFCILVLSQKNIRLLRGTRESVEELPLTETPTSMEEFQKYDVHEKSLSSASGAGGTKSMFHGWGDAGLEDKAVENYLKRVENEVTSILRKQRDPLILAGIDEAVAVYRKVNHYDRLMEEAVIGNQDTKNNDEIRDAGWGIIENHFLKDMYDDMEKYGNLTGSDKQSDNISKIVEGAYYGKVESLFIPIGEHSWGYYDESRDVVHLSAERENGQHDLLNIAAIKTLSQGGNVYALRKEEMPSQAPVAAVFRY